MEPSAPFGTHSLPKNLPKRFAFKDVPDYVRREQMAWDGTLKEVFDKLEPMVDNNSLKDGFWFPARVVRAMIDSDVNDVMGVERVQLVQEAAEFAMGMYAGTPDKTLLHRLMKETAKRGMHKNGVAQRLDEITVIGSKPDLTDEAAARLLERTEGDPTLMLIVCHGGIVAGSQITLEYDRLCEGESDTLIYPARYSRDKLADNHPYMYKAELDHLSRIVGDRLVVICDEDAFTGKTIEGMRNQMEKNLPDSDIVGLVAYDHRSAENRYRQGEWWDAMDDGDY